MLEVLDLSGNGITDTGGDALAAALSSNTVLKSINLSGNFLSLGRVESLNEQETRTMGFSRAEADFQKSAARR